MKSIGKEQDGKVKITIESKEKEADVITNFNEFVLMACRDGAVQAIRLNGSAAFINLAGAIFQKMALDDIMKSNAINSQNIKT